MSKVVNIFYGGFLRKAGGAFCHARTIEQELVRLGWDVRIVTLDDLPRWCKYMPHVAERLINRVHMPFGFLFKGKLTKLLYRHYFGGVVDLRIFEDVYMAWDSPTPSISILHALWSDNLHAFPSTVDRERKVRVREAELINKIRQPVVTVSFPYRQYIVEDHLAGYLAKDLDVIELGIDQSSFDQAYEVKRRAKSIIYSGTLEARKNPMFLLEVFQKLHEADSQYTLTILGDGPFRGELERFSKRNSLPISFRGRVDHSEVISNLFRHELYIHASVKESFSYALLEAKMAGLTTCAYSGLQIPEEFVDVGFDTFSSDEWSRRILQLTPRERSFDKSKYSLERMTRATLELVALRQ